MKQTGRTSRRLRSITAVAAIMVATAVLVPSSAQATMTFRSSSITLGVRDNTPSGAVGGVQSPAEAGSTLSLTIDASDTGSGLASAQASIDGNTASVSLCSASPCPQAVSNIPLSIDVGGAGSNMLLVTVTDAVGNTDTLLEAPIEVLDPVAPGSNTVTVGISAMHEGPPVESLEEPRPQTSAQRTAAAYRLSAPRRCWKCALPPRRSDIPARAYPCCAVAGATASQVDSPACTAAAAPWRPTARPSAFSTGLGRRTFKARPGTMLVHGGSLSAMFAFKSARTIIFRYSQAGGEDVEVRISTAIARRDPHNHRGRRRGRAR